MRPSPIKVDHQHVYPTAESKPPVARFHIGDGLVGFALDGYDASETSTDADGNLEIPLCSLLPELELLWDKECERNSSWNKVVVTDGEYAGRIGYFYVKEKPRGVA